MFGFRGLFEIIADYIPLVIVGLIVWGVVYILTKVGVIKKKDKKSDCSVESSENKRRYREVDEIREKAKINTADKFFSCVKNNNDTYVWELYWKDTVSLKDKRLKKADWVNKYKDIIEEKIKALYHTDKVFFNYTNEKLDFFDYSVTLIPSQYSCYEEWKNAFQLEYVVFTKVKQHFENEELEKEECCSTPYQFIDLTRSEEERVQRQREFLERKLDYQTPSMEDMKYGAVRKDRYGNLYTAGGTVIDKAAEELKRQSKKK